MTLQDMVSDYKHAHKNTCPAVYEISGWNREKIRRIPKDEFCWDINYHEEIIICPFPLPCWLVRMLDRSKLYASLPIAWF